MSDPTAFVSARLDEEQARAEAMEHFTNPLDEFYSCAGSRTEPYGDLPWGEEHCDCFVAERKAKRLREIAAVRAVIALHEEENPAAGPEYYSGLYAAMMALAGAWSDHAGFRAEWKP